MLDTWQLKDIDWLLTDLSTGFIAHDLVGESVAPITPVGVLAGRYMVYDQSDWLIFDDVRAPGTVANEIVGGKWSTDTFSVVEHSLQVPVFDEEREEAAAADAFPVDFGLDEQATLIATRSIALGHEYLISTTFRNTASYASASYYTTLSGTSQWSDYSGTSDPVNVVENAIRQVYVGTGRRPNKMIMPWIVWSYLRNHPKIVDRFKAFRLTAEDAFKELTGFDGELIIAESQYNSAQNVDATPAVVDFWGKDVWLGVVDPQPGQRTKTFAKTFMYPYQGKKRPVDTWREESRKADLFRASERYDLKIVSNTGGYLIKNAVA